MDPFLIFNTVAFRVEALPMYIDGTDESVELDYFRRKNKVPLSHNTAWAGLVRDACQRGGRVERLRLVSNPLSEYEQYELAAGYDAGVDAGEEIHIARSADYPKAFDFWMYDNSLIEVMNYDERGFFTGSVVRTMTASDRRIVAQMLAAFRQAPSLVEYKQKLRK